MSDSIFTKIINGELPCHKVYEDDLTLAFLDIDPLIPYHLLVIPKLQVDHVADLPDDYYQALFATVKRVSNRARSILGVKRAVIMIMGYDVPHAHVHVLPSDSGRDFYQATADRLARMDQHGQPDPADHEKLATQAAELAF